MMTPGDFATVQEGYEKPITEDYISWRLRYAHEFGLLYLVAANFSLSLLCVCLANGATDKMKRKKAMKILFLMLSG